MVDEAILQYWKKKIEEACNKTSTSLMYQSVSDKPHLQWDLTTSDRRDVCQACIKAKMLASAYML